MKTKIIYLLIAFAIVYTCLIHGQDYHPMLGDSNKWYVVKTFEGSYTDLYETKGDTLIEGKNYKLILFYHGAVQYFKPDSLGFLREDLINRKLWRRWDTTEVIYLDFSLKKNDSIFIKSYSKYSTGWYYVDSVGIINILAGNRKIIFLSRDTLGSAEKPVWIESVGSIGHPLYPEITPSEFNIGALSCFYKNEDKVYQSIRSQEYNECIFTKIVDLSKDLEITISPNPAKGIIQIKYPNIIQYKISVFDVYGKQLLILDKPTNIELNNFQPGIYLLVFKSASQSIFKKLIVNK
jgi:hypothetical protein